LEARLVGQRCALAEDIIYVVFRIRSELFSKRREIVKLIQEMMEVGFVRPKHQTSFLTKEIVPFQKVGIALAFYGGWALTAPTGKGNLLLTIGAK
jgi:hypothetical protein